VENHVKEAAHREERSKTKFCMILIKLAPYGATGNLSENNAPPTLNAHIVIHLPGSVLIWCCSSQYKA
jgi:hypothetical protein